MQPNRRQFLAGLGGLVGPYAFFRKAKATHGDHGEPAGATPQARRSPRIILLGTKGGPSVGTSGRNNPSTLILINDVPYIIDCGYGVSRQLISAGVALDRLRYIFITHHHSDHNLEYGPLLYNAWVSPKRPNIDVYGPSGLQELTHAFFAYQKFDIDTRIVDEGMTDLRELVSIHEFDAAGVVMQNDDVKVTSCRVPHPPITQAYAYRFDAKDRSVVISGDTAYAPALAQFANGADVLVHEAMYLPAIEALIKRATNASRLREHLLASHTSTEDVGRIAAAAEVKTLVLSHLVPGDDPSITDDQWSEGARKYFKGRVIVGKDLMEI
jgi:ribonuclease BN (tRNA processing enzyme)